jgi:hypothetical protein
MVRYEILIKLNDEMKALDTYDVDPIQLIYNIADIKDISFRNSSHSKSIIIPEKGNNRQIFNDIGDLNNEGDFNPNLKTEAWVLVDSIVIFKGFLQLRNVITDLETGKREYEIIIYAQNDNFFKEIGDAMLTDLDYSELNHIWNKENIQNSWSSTTIDNQGYFYPLIDYGYNWNMGSINGFEGNEVTVSNMYPATSVKYLWDKVFSNAGYTYQSEFINSDVFKNLFIPFNQQNFSRGEIPDTSQYFSVGMTGDTIIKTSIVSPPLVQLQNPVNLGIHRIPFSNENSPYGDPDNLYDISLFEYEAPSGFASQRFVCDFNLTFRHGLQLLGIGAGNSVCTIRFKRSKNQNGVDIPPTSTNPTGGRIVPVNGSITTIPLNSSSFNLSFGSNINNDPATVIGQISTDILDNTPSADGRFLKLFPNEKLWVEVTAIADNAQIRTDVGVPTGPIILANYDIFTANTQNVLFNVLEQLISADELYPYGAAIPKKFKQKDFITSITKMFNLYIEPSKEFDKTLIIEPRDQFYELGDVKDWTKKLDTTQPLNIQILGDTQNNEIKLTYKKDSDFYNEDYFNIRTDNEVYGQFSKFLENDFISGTRKVEPEFAATPLVDIEGSNSNFIIPQIFKVDNGTVKRSESKPRILTRFYSSTKESWNYDDFVFYSDSGQPNNSKTMLTTSGITNVPHNFILGDVVTIVQSDGGLAQPWLTGTFEIVAIPDIYSIVIDKFFVGLGGPAVAGIATPTDGLVGLGPQSQNGALYRWQFEGDTFSLYPYLGHFCHPLKPAYDINFGQTNGLYYETNVVTNNNLYEVYWKNSVEELMDKSSRIITANFYLSPDDIANFKFSDSIFVDGQYYKVNKINYDPTKTITSSVELIKSNYVTVPIQQSITQGGGSAVFNPNGTAILNPNPSIVVSIRPGNISTSSTNNIQGTDNIVTGKGNNVFGQDNYIGGLNNIISGKNNFVNGSGNTIDSTSQKILIIGDNNIVESGVTNSLVIGQGLTITESNTFVVPNLEVDGEIISPTDNIVIVSNTSNIIDTVSTNINNAILGGSVNVIDESQASTILGGGNNSILSSTASNILGGGNNQISTFSLNCSILSGSDSQIASGIDSVIVGGGTNLILGSEKSIILGGELNLDTQSINSAIVGGNANEFTLNTFNSAILGGDTNLIDGAAQSAIIAGSNNIIEANTASIIASNTSSILNASTGSVILGGGSHEIDNSSGSVLGGSQNDILNSSRCSINGGLTNFITTSSDSAILNGQLNQIDTSSFSAIIGGLSNTISSGVFRSVILGGTVITATQNDTVYVPNLVVVNSITPTGTADAQGVEGQITWDDDYVYVKTSVGWKRSALSTF